MLRDETDTGSVTSYGTSGHLLRRSDMFGSGGMRGGEKTTKLRKSQAESSGRQRRRDMVYEKAQ